MNNQPPPTPQGEPLDRDTLLALAEVDALDLEAAAEWWDTHATDDWRGVLDGEPVDDE
jgi:hypothetical protein